MLHPGQPRLSQVDEAGLGNGPAFHTIVISAQLSQAKSERGQNRFVVGLFEVFVHQLTHDIVKGLAAWPMVFATATKMPQSPMKGGMDVVKLMDDGDQSLSKGKHQESGNAKGQMIEDFPAIQKVPLDLVNPAPPFPRQISPFESQRCDSGLKPMQSSLPVADNVENQPVWIDVK